MAHFAQIENNIVTQIIVVSNQALLDNGIESESKGIEFCVNLLGGTWKQTSYNSNFRKNYAGIGYAYDESRDAFIAPKPFASWVLVEDTCQWKAPIDMPIDDKEYKWDEEQQNWVEVIKLN
jgi:hypothetical protein